MSARPSRAECAYAPYYCEENAYHLALRPELAALERWVVFISNPRRACPLWQQRAAPVGAWVQWDYHAIVVVQDEGLWAWDLDSRLPFPSPLPAYLAGTFPFAGQVPEALQPRFRVVPAALMASTFASDRSHMRTAHGGFRKPPPPWPPVQAAGQPPSNLMRFVDMQAPFVGAVMGLDALTQL